jgi:hypothetical protein
MKVVAFAAQRGPLVPAASEISFLKLFCLARASINVALTVKCSVESRC